MGSAYEAAPSPWTTADTGCSGLYAGCCSLCLSRGCIGMSVGEGSCSFVFPSEQVPRTTHGPEVAAC